MIDVGVGESSLWLEDSSDITADLLHLQPTAGAKDRWPRGHVLRRGGSSSTRDSRRSTCRWATWPETRSSPARVPRSTERSSPSTVTHQTACRRLARRRPDRRYFAVHQLGDPALAIFSDDHAMISIRRSKRSPRGTSPGLQLLGDTNGDSVVDLEDLNNVRNSFGATGPNAVGITTTTATSIKQYVV